MAHGYDPRLWPTAMAHGLWPTAMAHGLWPTAMHGLEHTNSGLWLTAPRPTGTFHGVWPTAFGLGRGMLRPTACIMQTAGFVLRYGRLVPSYGAPGNSGVGCDL